jgi:outer membrane translocation and assembly module TamA
MITPSVVKEMNVLVCPEARGKEIRKMINRLQETPEDKEFTDFFFSLSQKEQRFLTKRLVIYGVNEKMIERLCATIRKRIYEEAFKLIRRYAIFGISEKLTEYHVLGALTTLNYMPRNSELHVLIEELLQKKQSRELQQALYITYFCHWQDKRWIKYFFEWFTEEYKENRTKNFIEITKPLPRERFIALVRLLPH